MDGGPEAITDAAELAQVRRRARGVWTKSALATAIVAVSLLLLG